jgi:hypothetical protein
MSPLMTAHLPAGWPLRCGCCADHRGFIWPVDLATQFSQANIDEVRFRHEFVVPYLLEQHGAGQDLVLAAHHVLEQTEFSRQEVERSVAASRCLIGEIKLDRSHAKDIRGCPAYLRPGPWSCSPRNAGARPSYADRGLLWERSLAPRAKVVGSWSDGRRDQIHHRRFCRRPNSSGLRETAPALPPKFFVTRSSDAWRTGCSWRGAPQTHQRQSAHEPAADAKLVAIEYPARLSIARGSLRMRGAFAAVRGCVAVVSIAPSYVVARAAIGPRPPEGGETDAPISDVDMSWFEVMPGRGVGGST